MSTVLDSGDWIARDALGLELKKEGMRLENRKGIAGFEMKITASRRAKLKN